MRDEDRQRYLELLKMYLRSDTLYDFMAYMHSHTCKPFANLQGWLKFAKENLSEEEFAEFYNRECYLEAKSDGSDIKEKEELKNKVADMAKRIASGKATIFDVIDEITPSLRLYMGMVKKLRFQYKLINMSIYSFNQQYYMAIKDYKKTEEYVIKFPDLNPDDAQKLKEFVSKYDLPVNSITLLEAYKNFKLKGLIKLKNKVSNSR